MIYGSLSPAANHVWQCTAFAVAAGLLTLALRRNPARVRHWVWVAASFQFLVPLSLLTWRVAPVSAPRNFSIVFHQVSQPFAAPIRAEILRMPVRQPASILPMLLFVAWACGVVGFAAAWWIRWRRIAVVVRAGSRVELPLPIAAISSPAFSEPGVYGLFRPVLLVPEGIIERLTPEQWQTVLAHELSHVRRQDNLIAAIQMLVETVFWFHPLVWWIGKRIFEEKERACDEEVVRLGNDPRIYAQGILKVCELCVESPIACVSGISGGNLRQRIERIVSYGAIRKLNRARKLLLGFAAVTGIAIPIAIGQQTAAPKFEVASIRANHLGSTSSDLGPPIGNRFTARNVYIKILMRVAYNVQDFQIVGAPDWTETDRFDIQATADRSNVNRDEYRLLLQSLLTERFGLNAHRETKEEPVFLLTAASGGSRLKESECAKDAAPNACQTAERTDRGSLRGHFVPMSELCSVLESITGRPVLDRTNLTGMYEIDLKWTPGLPAADDLTGPSLTTAIEEQLGLKLQSGKGPVSMLMVEHIERPSEN
jgi:bla regulator protein BlaR1